MCRPASGSGRHDVNSGSETIRPSTSIFPKNRITRVQQGCRGPTYGRASAHPTPSTAIPYTVVAIARLSVLWNRHARTRQPAGPLDHARGQLCSEGCWYKDDRLQKEGGRKAERRIGPNPLPASVEGSNVGCTLIRYANAEFVARGQCTNWRIGHELPGCGQSVPACFQMPGPGLFRHFRMESRSSFRGFRFSPAC
jgi:hypothetical protein